MVTRKQDDKKEEKEPKKSVLLHAVKTYKCCLIYVKRKMPKENVLVFHYLKVLPLAHLFYVMRMKSVRVHSS